MEHRGIGESHAEFTIQAPSGIVSPSLVNLDAGWMIRILVTLRPEEILHIGVPADGRIGAIVRLKDGLPISVPKEKMVIGPWGALERYRLLDSAV